MIVEFTFYIFVMSMSRPKGPPLPPQDVQVLCGQAPGVLQVHWTPPSLSPTGTSNGANVVGYAVCTKGQRVRSLSEGVPLSQSVCAAVMSCVIRARCRAPSSP